MQISIAQSLIGGVPVEGGDIKAAKPDVAVPLYERFVKQLEVDLGKKVQTGQFGADMKVDLLNEGPVTIIIDSKNKV